MKLKKAICPACKLDVNFETLEGFDGVVLCPNCTTTQSRKEIETDIYNAQQLEECRPQLVFTLEKEDLDDYLVDLIDNMTFVVDFPDEIKDQIDVTEAENDHLIQKDNMSWRILDADKKIIEVTFTKGGKPICQEQ